MVRLFVTIRVESIARLRSEWAEWAHRPTTDRQLYPDGAIFPYHLYSRPTWMVRFSDLIRVAIFFIWDAKKSTQPGSTRYPDGLAIMNTYFITGNEAGWLKKATPSE